MFMTQFSNNTFTVNRFITQFIHCKETPETDGIYKDIILTLKNQLQGILDNPSTKKTLIDIIINNNCAERHALLTSHQCMLMALSVCLGDNDLFSAINSAFRSDSSIKDVVSNFNFNWGVTMSSRSGNVSLLENILRDRCPGDSWPIEAMHSCVDSNNLAMLKLLINAWFNNAFYAMRDLIGRAPELTNHPKWYEMCCFLELDEAFESDLPLDAKISNLAQVEQRLNYNRWKLTERQIFSAKDGIDLAIMKYPEISNHLDNQQDPYTKELSRIKL